VRDGIAEEMRRDKHILYFGEGTGERGGTFAHTKNLWTEFGAHRMVDTPISEQGFTGAAIGASATGSRTIADLMFADFVFEAAGQIVLQAAKLRYMSNGQMNAPMVVRVGSGAVRSSAGPHHSGTLSSELGQYSGPDRLHALDAGRRQGPDEDSAAGRRSRHDAGAEGAVRHQGRSADGRAFRAVRRWRGLPAKEPTSPSSRPDSWCIALLEAAEKLAAEGISAEVIDLRTIMPLDVGTSGAIGRARRTACWWSTKAGARLASAPKWRRR
jgi:2-oxoisovalerate dehydrogenase E1 component